MKQEQDIIKFFKNYNIDIQNDDILFIKHIKIPNFYKKFNNNEIIKWEFCHLLYKIYGSYITNNIIFYENNYYHITNTDIVFDCGANMGLFAAYAAAQGAKVYAFEPMSFTRNMLAETVKLYPDNIIICPYAVKDENKKSIFAQCDNPGASHDLTLQIDFHNKILYQEQIECISLDSFIKTYNIIPTFIKIDIEGSEQSCIEGSIHLLKQYKPVLSMSLYHDYADCIVLPSILKNINNLYNLHFFQEDNSSGLYLIAK